MTQDSHKISLERFNSLGEGEKDELLKKACFCETWSRNLRTSEPFPTLTDLLTKAEEVWFSCDENAWLQAFDAHPKIGDPASLKKKYQATLSTAKNEQSKVEEASDEIINELAEYNENYAKKFGFIFIVFATGKSAAQMLTLLKERINNSREVELKNAATEQNKITRLRLENMICHP